MARLKELQAEEMRRHDSIRSDGQQRWYRPYLWSTLADLSPLGREMEAVKRELEAELRKEAQREVQAVKDRYQRQLEEDERQYQQQVRCVHRLKIGTAQRGRL